MISLSPRPPPLAASTPLVHSGVYRSRNNRNTAIAKLKLVQHISEDQTHRTCVRRKANCACETQTAGASAKKLAAVVCLIAVVVATACGPSVRSSAPLR